MNRNLNRRTFGLSMMVIAAAATVAMAGPLNPPPGPITSTMKTLAEVEPRTAINATNTPGDSTAMFNITQSGSYYLTSNVVAPSGKDGISIDASNVTIDLNGFTISGLTGSRTGVSGLGVSRVTIRNGHIVSMGTYGIYLPSSGNVPQNITIEDVVVRSSVGDGIHVGSGVIRNCQSDRNGTMGIFVIGYADSLIESCTANGNGTGGINAGHGNITSSTTKGNNTTGISLNSGTISHCTAADNATGIISYSGSVLDSTALDNTTVGIRVNGDCLVRGNNISNGSFIEQSIGIQVQNTAGARIEGNSIARTYVGVSLLTGNNLAISNSFRGCTHAFNVAANNRIGAIVTATASPMFIGNVGGGLGTTDPYANILH